MLISIIIPTYAPGEYIYECLDSLSAQTSGPESFEAIVVLNGEKDPYFNSIQTYLIDRNFRFKLLHTEEKGVSNARNTALDAIEPGNFQYIVFLDDDDKLSPNFIEEVSKKANPGVIVASNSKSFIDGQNIITGKGYISNCYEGNMNVPYSIFKYRCFLSTVWGKLYPLTVIGKTRFNTNFSIGEDSLFAFAISNSIKEIVLTGSDAFCYRRLRLNSMSRKRRNRVEKCKHGFRLCIAYSKVYFKNPFGYNLFFFISRIVATFVHCIKRDNSSTLNDLIQKGKTEQAFR